MGGRGREEREIWGQAGVGWGLVGGCYTGGEREEREEREERKRGLCNISGGRMRLSVDDELGFLGKNEIAVERVGEGGRGEQGAARAERGFGIRRNFAGFRCYSP